MSLNKKLIFLIFIFVILIVYSILSFDYTKVNSKNENDIRQVNDVIKIKNKDKAISFEISKVNNLVIINGEFKNRVQLQYLIEYLNINKEDKTSFDNMIVLDQDNIDEIQKLISPLKDYFVSGSKIVLKDKKILLKGKIKDKKFYNLILTILDKSKVKISQEIDLEKVEVTEVLEKDIIEEIKTVPKETLQSKINKLVKETKVTFKRKSSKPTEKTLILLKNIAALIKEEENIKIELAGHTDARGPSALNKRLSLFRAGIIKKELVKLGVKASMLTTIGYGEEQLIKKGSQHYSKLNRRVEFNVSILTPQEASIMQLQDEINSVIKNKKIEFKRRSTEVTQKSLEALEEIALLIMNSNDIKIEIAGHTDAKGRASLNKKISEQRANGVKEQLIKLGVNKELLTAVGYGETKPIAQNDKNGLSKINRRVEFYVMGKK